GRPDRRLSCCKSSRQKQEVLRGMLADPSILSAGRVFLNRVAGEGQEEPCSSQVAARKQHEMLTKVPLKAHILSCLVHELGVSFCAHVYGTGQRLDISINSEVRFLIRFFLAALPRIRRH